ncbi:carotenoid oxygenase family protein [Pseudoalteromonas sp. SG41-1]|uniref:carotenoid oxygenase family protein n=1 Tax=Pseudoalteromonas sp. SG41-1 TaxID=2760979 RepID=UPI0038572BA6
MAKTNSNREGQGYIINTWLDYGSAKSGVAVFDAEKIGQGPLASMQLPYHLPLGFHGAIV